VRRRGAYRAAHRRQGLNLAASDVHYLFEGLTDYYASGSMAGIDAYSERALARVWKASGFRGGSPR
jgi:p-hydroxybenzoate 3-monooxygenase